MTPACLPRVRRMAALARATAAVAEGAVAELEHPLDGKAPDPDIVHAALSTVHQQATRLAHLAGEAAEEAAPCRSERCRMAWTEVDGGSRRYHECRLDSPHLGPHQCACGDSAATVSPVEQSASGGRA